jgi:hypothetical protein
MNKIYSEEEKEFIKSNSHIKDEDLWLDFQTVFNRDIKFPAFRKLRQRLGIKKQMGRPNGKT